MKKMNIYFWIMILIYLVFAILFHNIDFWTFTSISIIWLFIFVIGMGYMSISDHVIITNKNKKVRT